MANRMNKVKALIGVAAIMTMSGLIAVPTHAAEPEIIEIEQAAEVTEAAPFEEVITVVEETAEEVEEAASASEETAQQIEETAPGSEETAQQAEETTPIVEEITPVTEETAPVAETTNPVSDEILPAEEETAPVEEVAVPSVEEAAPVVEEAVSPEDSVETKPVFEEIVIPTGYREAENDLFNSVTREENAGISADDLKTPEIAPEVKDQIEALKNAEKSGAVSDQGTQKKESNEVTPSDETVPVEKTETTPSDETVPAEKTEVTPSDETIPAEKTETTPSDETVPAEKTETTPSDETVPAEKTEVTPSDETVPAEKTETITTEKTETIAAEKTESILAENTAPTEEPALLTNQAASETANISAFDLLSSQTEAPETVEKSIEECHEVSVNYTTERGTEVTMQISSVIFDDGSARIIQSMNGEIVAEKHYSKEEIGNKSAFGQFLSFMNTSEPVANRDAYLTMLNEKEEKAAQNREPAKAQELDPNQKADEYIYAGTSDKATIRKDSSGNIQIEYNATDDPRCTYGDGYITCYIPASEAEGRTIEELAKSAAAYADNYLGEKDRLRDIVGGMSATELLDYWQKINTVDQNLAKGSYKDGNKEATKEEKEIKDILEDLGMDVMKEIVGAGIDAAFDQIPGASIVGGPVKDLFLKSIGLEQEETDVAALIKEQTQEIKDTLDQMVETLKKSQMDTCAFVTYNETLTEFENFVDNRMTEVAQIEKNTEYNEIDKLVRKAETIGGEDKWITGDTPVFDLMRNAAKVLQGGKTTDLNDRSYFDVLYDYFADESLFAGEAMQKAEKYIDARVERFAGTCDQLMDLLTCAKKVAELTTEQIDSMAEDTRAIYDNIKTRSSAILIKMQEVANVFGEPVETDSSSDVAKNRSKGILETAYDYYNKDKTVYIDKGKKEIDLKDELKVAKGSEYSGYYYNDNVDGKHRCVNNGDDVARDVRKQVDGDISRNGGLKADDITKIYDQAKSSGMTIKEYLRYCGFETENLGNGILVRNSYEGGHGGIDGGCYRAGASGYHVDSYDKVKGKGHDHRGSGIDYIKVFDVGANYHNPWIYDDQNANNWFIFFVQE